MSDDGSRISLGLRAKLMIALIPVLIGIFGVVFSQVQDQATGGLQDLSNKNLVMGADGLADSLRSILDDSYADAMTTSKLDLAAEAIDSEDPKNLIWYADEIVYTKKKYVSILVTDVDGRIVASNEVDRFREPLKTDLYGVFIDDLSWFKRVISEEDVNSVIFVPPTDSKFLKGAFPIAQKLVGFSIPVNDVIDERLGTVTLLLSMSYLSERLDPYSSVVDGEVESLAMLVDKNNVPVVLPSELKNQDIWEGVEVPNSADGGLSEWLGPDGNSYQLASSSVGARQKEVEWRLVTMNRVDVINRPANLLLPRSNRRTRKLVAIPIRTQPLTKSTIR
jgi:hypothetical protein